ncbi:MAG: hypothetical protein OXG04_18690 [Acidobacteria bacterium]|nr:hypothetical protein [Acidobacteriota bacterium]
MQIKANLGSFNAVWAVVVHRVRGGFDRDAFTGINVGKNSRAIDAGSIIVTGGARPPALHIAAAAPDGAAVPVRLPPPATQTPSTSSNASSATCRQSRPCGCAWRWARPRRRIRNGSPTSSAN